VDVIKQPKLLVIEKKVALKVVKEIGTSRYRAELTTGVPFNPSKGCCKKNLLFQILLPLLKYPQRK
jgi:hypothetical protein